MADPRNMKPQPWPTAVKCTRCRGTGTAHSQQSFSGVKGGKWSAKTCPKCWGVGWKSKPGNATADSVALQKATEAMATQCARHEHEAAQ